MATEPTRRRRTRSDGERSHRAILEAAGRLATTDGLDGISIARVASEIGMSKSGLFSHFASKEDLQMATIDAAEAIYAAEVIEPALEQPQGMPQLRALCERYVSYVERGVFPGRCLACGGSLPQWSLTPTTGLGADAPLGRATTLRADAQA